MEKDCIRTGAGVWPIFAGLCVYWIAGICRHQHKDFTMTTRSLLMAGACMGLSLVLSDAGAVDVQRAPSVTANGACQAALPVFDGQIRKRPLAVQNEGSSNAFITCSLPAEGTAFGGTSRVFVYFVNPGGVQKQVDCTMVSSLSGTASYFPKAITVPANPGGNGHEVNWTAVEDNGGNNFSRWTSLSCNLPPGIGIGHLGKNHEVNVGN